jgi:hypothetical protein
VSLNCQGCRLVKTDSASLSYQCVCISATF